jgi:hypothetical protein
MGEGSIPLPDVGRPYALGRVKPRIRVKAISRPHVPALVEAAPETPAIVATSEPAWVQRQRKLHRRVSVANDGCPPRWGVTLDGKYYGQPRCRSIEGALTKAEKLSRLLIKLFGESGEPAPVVVAAPPRMRIPLHLLASTSPVAYRAAA